MTKDRQGNGLPVHNRSRPAERKLLLCALKYYFRVTNSVDGYYRAAVLLTNFTAVGRAGAIAFFSIAIAEALCM